MMISHQKRIVGRAMKMTHLQTTLMPSSVSQEDPYTQAKHRTVPACLKEQAVRDGFREEVEKLKHQAVGSFSDRISPDLRGINVNPKLMLCESPPT